MPIYHFLKVFFIFIIINWLCAACSSTQLAPLDLAITPASPSAPATASASQVDLEDPDAAFSFQLIVQDQRSQHHFVRWHQGPQPAQFITLEQPLEQYIRPLFKAPFQLSQHADTQVLLKVDQGLCVAHTELTSHHMRCSFVYHVEAKAVGSLWQKTYTSERQRKGRLALKNKYIQEDIAHILTQAMRELTTDHEFLSWLHQQ